MLITFAVCALVLTVWLLNVCLVTAVGGVRCLRLPPSTANRQVLPISPVGLVRVGVMRLRLVGGIEGRVKPCKPSTLNESDGYLRMLWHRWCGASFCYWGAEWVINSSGGIRVAGNWLIICASRSLALVTCCLTVDRAVATYSLDRFVLGRGP